MNVYITLLRFTEKGARLIKQSPSRAAAFDRMAERHGVTVQAQYWTVGAYDGILILKAPKATSILACLAELASAGHVRPETLQAFDAAQFKAITKGV